MSLSSAEIASIISIENDWMTTDCSVYRASLSSDGMGGFTETWYLVESTVCDLWEGQGRTEETSYSANQDISKVYWFSTLPYDTDILAKDILIVGNQAFDIISTPLKQSINTALRCQAVTRNNFELSGVSVYIPGDYELQFNDASNSMYLGVI